MPPGPGGVKAMRPVPPTAPDRPTETGPEPSRRLAVGQGVQPQLGIACLSAGKVMRHPGACAGTNPDVLGFARRRDHDGGCAPRARDIALVQVYVVVSARPLPTPMT